MTAGLYARKRRVCHGLRRMDQIKAELLVSRAAKARTNGASMMITG